MSDLQVQPIRLVEIASASDTDILAGNAAPEGYSRDDMVERLSRHEVRRLKDGPGYLPAIFKDSKEWVRSRLTGDAARRRSRNIRLALGEAGRKLGEDDAAIAEAIEIALERDAEAFERIVANALVEAYQHPAFRGYLSAEQNARYLAPMLANALDLESDRLDDLFVDLIAKVERPNYRNDLNVAAISMIVLDLDEAGVIDEARSLLGEFDYVIHSTHSYSKERPHKFRIVLFPQAPIAAEHWRGAFECFASALRVDKACKNESRLYYWPSITPDAGVRPHFEYNQGRPITLEDIHSLGREHGANLARERPTRRVALGAAPERLRHYAGGMRPVFERNIGLAGQTYEDYCERHRNSIDRWLADHDSRHDFALSACAREIRRFGPRTDFERLAHFIFRAARQFGSRSLLTGNTPDELPEMMESALLKSEVPNLGDLSERIRDAIASACDAENAGGKWVFDQDANTPSTEDVLAEMEREYSYPEMVERHREALSAFAEDSSEQRVPGLARRVLLGEWRRTLPQLDVYAVAEFVYRVALSYLARTAPQRLEGARLASSVALITERLDESLLPMEGRQRDRYAREWRHALELVEGFACAGAKWQFTAAEQSKAPAPMPGAAST